MLPDPALPTQSPRVWPDTTRLQEATAVEHHSAQALGRQDCFRYSVLDSCQFGPVPCFAL